MIGQIMPAAQGLQCGLQLAETKRLEDSVNAGRNAYLTSGLQFVQATSTFEICNRALVAAGKEIIPLHLRLLTYLTAPLLAVLTQPWAGIENEIMRDIILFLQDHFSDICHLVSVVSSVALIHFGSVAFGATALTVLAIGFLDRHKVLPECVRRVIHEYSSPLMFTTGVFIGDIISRIYALFTAFCYGAGVYLNWKEKQDFSDRAKSVKQDVLNAQDMQDFLNRRKLPGKRLEINRNYVHCSSDPAKIPDIDIELLLSQFDAIDWSGQSNINALRRKLSNDQRFVQRHLAKVPKIPKPEDECPRCEIDDKLIEICRKDLEICLDAVKNHRFQTGEPKEYDSTHDKLKVITDYYTQGRGKYKDPTELIDFLLQLAIEGGAYCGPGVIDTVEIGYVLIIGDSELFTTRGKVLSCLQEARGRIVQEVYVSALGLHERQGDELPAISMMKTVVDFQDRHNYHQFLNLYAHEFRVRKAAAENDEIAIIDPVSKLAISYFLGHQIQEFFWDGHTLDDVTQALHKEVGGALLPKPLIYAWLQGWIDRQESLVPTKKRQLHSELSNGRLFGSSLEYRGKFTPELLHAMLYDMGVIEAKTV